jgi:hypothetical protein
VWKFLGNKKGVCGITTAKRNYTRSWKRNQKHSKEAIIFPQKGWHFGPNFERQVSDAYDQYNSWVRTGEFRRQMWEVIKMSSCTLGYNKYMKGVDRANQLLSYYSILEGRGDKVIWSTALYPLNSTPFNAFLYIKLYTKIRMQKAQFCMRWERMDHWKA